MIKLALAEGSWIVSVVDRSGSIVKAWPVKTEVNGLHDVELPGYEDIPHDPGNGFHSRKVLDRQGEWLAEWLAERNGVGTVLESR